MKNQHTIVDLLSKLAIIVGIGVCLFAIDFSMLAPARTQNKARHLRLLIKETIRERLNLESKIYDKKRQGENTLTLENLVDSLREKQKKYEEEYIFLSVAQRRPRAVRPSQ